MTKEEFIKKVDPEKYGFVLEEESKIKWRFNYICDGCAHRFNVYKSTYQIYFESCYLNTDTLRKIADFVAIIKNSQKIILTDEEKKFLNCFVEPFKEDDLHFTKHSDLNGLLEFVEIFGLDRESGNKRNLLFLNNVPLIHFKAGTMFKGMDLNKKYSLEELGLL